MIAQIAWTSLDFDHRVGLRVVMREPSDSGINTMVQQPSVQRMPAVKSLCLVAPKIKSAYVGSMNIKNVRTKAQDTKGCLFDSWAFIS